MTNLPAKTNGEIMERVLIAGNLAGLTAEERVNYYKAVCESVGLNPLTKPFDYITLNGRLTLYALKGASDQLRKINKVSIYKIEKEQIGDLFTVTAYARDGESRTDSDLGVVSIIGLNGDKLANAMMKAMTKAKRRVTLSICGLGWLDESEIETIPNARPIEVDDEGVIVIDKIPQDSPLAANGDEPDESATCDPERVKEWRVRLENAKNITIGTLASILAGACPERWQNIHHATGSIHKRTDFENNEAMDVETAMGIFVRLTDDALAAVEGERDA